MKDITKWMSLHPLKSAGFAALFGFIPPFLCAMPDSWAWPGAFVFLLCALAWGVVIHFDLKTAVALALSVVLLAPPAKAEKPQEGPLAIGAGLIVLCTGGYCVYKLVKFCQKKFPKETAGNTNDPPEGIVFNSTGTGGGKKGGSWNFGDTGSCGEPEKELYGDEEQPVLEPITFVLDLWLHPGPVLTHSISIRKGEGTFQTWQEFQQEAVSEGLVLTGNADGSQWFSKDGQPCQAWEVPLHFDTTTMTARHLAGGQQRTVVIHRSEDLVTWYPLLRVGTGEGTGFQVVDTSTKSTVFFKVQLTE